MIFYILIHFEAFGSFFDLLFFVVNIAYMFYLSFWTVEEMERAVGDLRSYNRKDGIQVDICCFSNFPPFLLLYSSS